MAYENDHYIIKYFSKVKQCCERYEYQESRDDEAPISSEF